MPDKGVRLQLFVGPTIPAPAPFDVMDSLISLEVRNNDSERDGFQLSFSLSKEKMLDYGLLLRHYFDPPARVIIAVTMGVLPEVLIDGIITNHQLSPSDKPGNST